MFDPRLFPLVFSAQALVAHAWTWPNPRMEDIESARWDASGYLPRTSIMGGLTPDCNAFFRGSGRGRSNAADWIRTAFHDMATYDPVTGTGGMDASIRYETDRAENAGNGFSLTLSFFRSDPGRYLSMADVLALAITFSVENCGGPEVNWRGGRVDAAAPNSPGVPEPQGTLQDHTAAFARMGFNQTEMIGLVACGHSIALGGVQRSAFPDLVPELNDPNNVESNAPFDTTVNQFDNKVAAQYIGGTTANPLVINPNDTFNSDKRIFGSDGNVTMAAFANSQSLFFTTCATLFSRMVEVVPDNVQLTDVIQPLSVKPRKIELVHRNTGFLSFSGEVRLWNPSVNSQRIVNLNWKDRSGGTHTTIPTHTPDMVGSASGGRYRSEWYKWELVPGVNSTSTPITEALSATGMEFQIDEMTGSNPVRIEDQQGLGFPVYDDVVFSATSCKTTNDWPAIGRYRVAVRKTATPHRVFIVGDAGFVNGAPAFTELDILPPANPPVNSSPYDVWEVDLDENQVFTQWALSVEPTATSGHLNIASKRLPYEWALC